MNNCCNQDIFYEEDMKRWETSYSVPYYTKAEIDEIIEDISISGDVITSGEVQTMIDAATEPIEGDITALSGAVEQLSTSLENKADKSDIPSLEGYATQQWVEGKNYLTEQSLEDYATKQEVIDNEYTISQAINDLNDRKLDASAYTPVDMSGYWTSGETQEAINAATSGTPSSATIEGLRNDVNALSGDVTNLYETKLDASAYTPTDLSQYWTSAQTKNYVDNAISGIPSGALTVDWSELVDQQLITDAKWNEIVDAIQNHREVYGYLDYSADGGGVDIYPLMSAAKIGIQGSNDSIILNSQSGDGTYILTITKNGSNNYSFSDSSYRFQPKLTAGSGISINNNNVISVTGGTSNILAVDWEGLMGNMNDEKWDSLVDAFQNNNQIYAIVDYSGEGFIDIDQKPIDGYVFIDGNTGEQGSRIELKRLTSDGYDWITITKNGSNNYTVTNGNVQYQQRLEAGTGIAINGNVISATGGGTGITIDQSLDSGSTNPVANSALTQAINAKADASNVYNKTEVNNIVNNKANVWCGDEASFNALTNKDANTIYLVY